MGIGELRGPFWGPRSPINPRSAEFRVTQLLRGFSLRKPPVADSSMQEMEKNIEALIVRIGFLGPIIL